jgi:hypothetical protein
VDATVTSEAHSSSRGRAFRGLVLTFVLSFVNLIGVIFTLTALGGLAPWSRWQFVGLFGVLEAASGLANVISPNLWRLPVDELTTSERTQAQLAGSTVLIPHWAAIARFAAGLVLVGVAAWHEGVTFSSAGVVFAVIALAWLILLVSAGLARIALLRPQLDVVKFSVRWGGRDREFEPVSISAAVLQFVLSIATVPAAKLLDPSALYRPEFSPSRGAVIALLAVSAILTGVVYLLWSGRVAWTAPREQQRQAEEQA